MQNPFSAPFPHEDLSQIHQTLQIQDRLQNLLNQSHSRYTAAQTLASTHNEEIFHSNRMFIMGTLQSWGMKLGYLPYSKDNYLTIKCILQLISQKQKEFSLKQKVKQQLNAANFDKQKFQSLLKLSKNNLSESEKKLGKVQNEMIEVRKKLKLMENQFKKQKIDDQKMIFMLRSKNQQVMHEMKKREAEVNKVKQQMKKNITSKSLTVNVKTQSPTHHYQNLSVKNNFQVIERIQKGWNVMKGDKKSKNMTDRMNINQNFTDAFEQQKFNFMVQKYEKEKKQYSNQNTMLRSKIFDIRQILVQFAEWIDVEVFGQKLQTAKKFLAKKFICNHNLMFSKNALIQDLNQIINEAKNGIVQLQSKLQQQLGGGECKNAESPSKNTKNNTVSNKSAHLIGIVPTPLFKKKSTSIKETFISTKQSHGGISSQKTVNIEKQPYKKMQIQKKIQGNINIRAKSPILRSKQIPSKFTNQSDRINKQLMEREDHQMPSQIKPESRSKYLNELQLSAFDHDILSDIYQPQNHEDQNSSVVSHISTSQLLKQATYGEQPKYDKWNILFNIDAEDEQ